MNDAHAPDALSLRDSLATLVKVVWSFTFGALHDFVWADLREGLIRLRGLGWTTRALIVGGFSLLALLLAAILWNDVWRAYSTLTPLTLDLDSVGRGALLPAGLVPVTMFLIAVAWSFALAGALHAHSAFRIATVAVYEITAAGWLQSIFTSGLRDDTLQTQVWVGVGLLVVVPLFFAARWRAGSNPPGEFCFLLAATAATFGYAQMAQNSGDFGIPLGLATLESNLRDLKELITPLLLVLGIDIANFARQAATWGTEFVTLRLPRAVTWVVLAGVVVLRVWDVVTDAVGRVQANGLGVEVLQYLGAFGELVIVGLVWFVVMKLGRGDGKEREALDEESVSLDEQSVAHNTERIALPLVLVYSAATLAIFLLYSMVTAIPAVGFGLTLGSGFNQAAAFVQMFIAEPWHNVVIAGAIVAGLYFARRGDAATGLFLALFGTLSVWAILTEPGAPLGFLFWRGPEPRDFAITVVLFGFVMWWLARDRLTFERATQALFLFLLTALLRRTDFISSPFSPFLGFAGVGFIAFGLAWDALTAGSWANEETPALPRASRILLYLGYILLTATLVNWALTSHDLNTLGQYTGDAALVGFTVLGRPLIFAIGALMLFGKTEEGGRAQGAMLRDEAGR